MLLLDVCSESLIDDEEAVFTRLLVLDGRSLFILCEDVSSFGEDLFSVGFTDLGSNCCFFFSKRVVLVVTAHLTIIIELKAG